METTQLNSTAGSLVETLKKSRHILSSVESCTGGLIAHTLTNIAGVSEVFWGAWVVYDNSAKEALGVGRELIQKHGAVSAEVAQALAEGGLLKMRQAQTAGSPSFALLRPRGFISLATTGIAGPGGGTLTKPVGLCFIGLAFEGRVTRVEEFRAEPNADREQIKSRFAQRALALVVQALEQEKGVSLL